MSDTPSGNPAVTEERIGKYRYTTPVNATEDWDNAQQWAHGLIATHYPNQIADTLCDFLMRAEAAEAALQADPERARLVEENERLRALLKRCDSPDGWCGEMPWELRFAIQEALSGQPSPTAEGEER